MRWPTRRLALLLVLPGVTAVGFGRLLAEPGSLIADGRRVGVDHADRGGARGVGNDLTSVFLPRFCYVVKGLRERGRLPHWDASGFGGRPLVGNPQAGLFYPPVWGVAGAGHPAGLGWLTVAHLVGAGFGVYVLTRSLGYRPLAAVVAGGCFEASPYLMAHTLEGHYPHVWAACWYPWAFWAANQARRGRSVGYWALPGILALTLLTGHPQEWYYLVLALGGWAAVEAVGAWRAGCPWRGLGVGLGLAVGVGLGLGLAAVEIAPGLAARPWSLTRGLIPLALINRYQLQTENLMQLLSPFALGGPADYRGRDNYWETLFSIGLTPLLLAGLGLVRHRDRPSARRWGWLVALAAVFAAGRRLGLYPLAYALVPGMERFRVPSRTLFLAALGASVLAGAGVDTLLGRGLGGVQWRGLRRRTCVGLLAVAAAVLAAPAVAPGGWLVDSARGVGGDGVFWAGLLATLGVLAWAGPGADGQVRAGRWLGAAALGELALYARALLVVAPVGGFVGVGLPPADLGGVTAEAVAGSGPPRLAAVGTACPDLWSVARGVEKTNVNDGFQIQHAADLYERLYPYLDARPRPRPTGGAMDEPVARHDAAVARAVLDRLAVGGLVADAPPPLTLPDLEPVPAEGGGVLRRNPTALPRAYVVPTAVALESTPRSAACRLGTLDPRDGVVLDADPLAGLGGVRQPFRAARWESHDPDLVTLRVETQAPGILVVASTWMPGWSAEVGGSPSPVLRGDHWAQAVALPRPGRHEVILRYRAPGFGAGAAVSLAALAGWTGLGLALGARALGCRGTGRSRFKLPAPGPGSDWGGASPLSSGVLAGRWRARRAVPAGMTESFPGLALGDNPPDFGSKRPSAADPY